MIQRVLSSGLLALCLALTSLGAVVAETRMAAGGGYCGTGAPQILLDDAGLPLLDAEGEAIAAPECPVCHMAIALADPPAWYGVTETLVATLPAPAGTQHLPFSLRVDYPARGPPHAA